MTKRKFDGKELRDATSPMMLPVLSLDQAAAEAVKSGEVNDKKRFQDCVVAQACMRTFGHDAKVRIMRTTAYISLPGEKYARRFEITDEARDVVEAFDRNIEVPVGTFIELRAPTKQRTLDVMRKNWHANKVRYQTAKTKRKQRASDPLAGVVRNGTYVNL